MSQAEIIEEIKKLSTEQKKFVVEEAMKLLKDEEPNVHELETRSLTLAEAAQIMKAEYEAGGELTAFSILDGEDMYEAR